jgi:hypothetical protein
MTGLLLRTDGSCWQTVRDLKPLDEPYGTLQFKRFLFGGTGWIAVADSYGAVYAADQRGWVDRTAEPPVELVALSGTDDDDLWAVGDSGAILHRTAMGWSHVPSRTATSLSGVWAIARNDVWATGGSSPPALLHYDGTAFATAVPPAPWSYSWNFVQATSPTDIWLVGGNFEVSRLSNGVWSSPSAVHPTTSTSGFWASGPADAWRAGSRYWYGSDHSYFTEPLFEHWDGQGWTAVPNPPYVGSMWGLSSRSIWAQSDQGLLHWDGASWNVVSPERLGSVWASADDDVWAITSAGVGRWDGKSWTNTRRLQTPVEYGGAHTLFGTRSGHIWVTGSAGLIARKRSPATKAQ